MKHRLVSLALLIILLSAIMQPARAQTAEPPRPVYIVQPGDSLWVIAARFGVSVDDLIRVNNLQEPINLHPGDQLLIPGLEGVSGRLETAQIGFGETLQSLSRRYNIPEDKLARLNRVSSASELYAGINLIVTEPAEDAQPLAQRTGLSTGETPLELAIRSGASVWQISAWNRLDSPYQAVPGEVLHLPGDDAGPGALPPIVQAITMTLPLVQGKTGVIAIQSGQVLSMTGTLDKSTLDFMAGADGVQYALQGVHAMTPPGLKMVTISGTLADGSTFGFSQLAPVISGRYVYDPDLQVTADTVDPAITEPENELWFSLFEKISPVKQWEGMFVSPVAPAYAGCYPSYYGNRRSYNSSGYLYFHTGLDFCSWNGDPIYAPAAGTVVFADTLIVRGGATVIDHGWGVYTAFMHQEQILVKAGQVIQAGEQIGVAGDTGRVTGPHLHFEVIVGGVQVDPLPWLENIYP